MYLNRIQYGSLTQEKQISKYLVVLHYILGNQVLSQGPGSDFSGLSTKHGWQNIFLEQNEKIW